MTGSYSAAAFLTLAGVAGVTAAYLLARLCILATAATW